MCVFMRACVCVCVSVCVSVCACMCVFKRGREKKEVEECVRISSTLGHATF